VNFFDELKTTEEAIRNRLLAVARALEERGWVQKGADMSPPAISARIRILASLSDMCRRLGRVGVRDATPSTGRRAR
jgi:hypothetical protein